MWAAERARAVTVALADKPVSKVLPVAEKAPQRPRKRRKAEPEPEAARKVPAPKRENPAPKQDILKKEPALSSAPEAEEREQVPEPESVVDEAEQVDAESIIDATAVQPREAGPDKEPPVQPAMEASSGREARPLYSRNEPPPYPRLARKKGYEGVVLLDVFVNENGRVSGVKVAQTSGFPILDRAARDAVHKWTFEPGIRNGVLTGMWVKVPVRFQLAD